MPTNTPNQQITLPVGADPADAPTVFTDQTADLETRLVQRFTNLADRTARNPAPSEGEVSVLVAENRTDIFNGGIWRSLAARSNQTSVFRSSDAVPIASTVTLVSDGILAATLDEPGTYRWHGRAYYDSSTVADLKIAFTWPTSTLAIWGLTARDVATTTNFQALTATSTGISIPAGGVGVGTGTFADFDGIVTVTATGTLQFQYAQNTSDPAATTLRAGSYLVVVREA